jgi:hypothetical protein
VDWTGDMNTAWKPAISPEERILHQRSLALALKSRIALLRIIMTTAQGAAKIAALIAAPGGALLALPAAWKYVQQLLSAVSEAGRANFVTLSRGFCGEGSYLIERNTTPLRTSCKNKIMHYLRDQPCPTNLTA